MSSRNSKIMICGPWWQADRLWSRFICLEVSFAEQLHLGSGNVSTGESFPSFPSFLLYVNTYRACEVMLRLKKQSASAMQLTLVMVTLLTVPLESVLTDLGAACDGGQHDKKQICKSIFGFSFFFLISKWHPIAKALALRRCLSTLEMLLPWPLCSQYEDKSCVCLYPPGSCSPD